MALKAIIQNAVKSMFTIMDDIAQNAIYTINANSSYNTATGEVSTTGTTQAISVIRDTYRVNEIDGKAILSTDLKLLTPVADFTGTPTTNDTVTINSIVYNVIGMPEKDPADAMYVIQARLS